MKFLFKSTSNLDQNYDDVDRFLTPIFSSLVPEDGTENDDVAIDEGYSLVLPSGAWKLCKIYVCVQILDIYTDFWNPYNDLKKYYFTLIF